MREHILCQQLLSTFLSHYLCFSLLICKVFLFFNLWFHLARTAGQALLALLSILIGLRVLCTLMPFQKPAFLLDLKDLQIFQLYYLDFLILVDCLRKCRYNYYFVPIFICNLKYNYQFQLFLTWWRNVGLYLIDISIQILWLIIFWILIICLEMLSINNKSCNF